MSASIKVPFDPELGAFLKSFPKNPPFTLENLPELRKSMDAMSSPEAVLSDPLVAHETKTCNGPNGEVKLAVFRLKDGAKNPRPAVYFIHGGGMVMGTRFTAVSMLLEWIKELDLVAISVEYRLGVDNPASALIEDCYAGFTWVGEHASELGIDQQKIIICGTSAGGGLSAGLALLVRDRGGPKILAQCLICPMLDDRMTASNRQYYTEGTFTGEMNETAWAWLLDGKQGSDDVSIYTAPARATDLSRLPPAWIDIGSAEPFRDENIAYATKLWAAGVQAEFHVWPWMLTSDRFSFIEAAVLDPSGAWHGFDFFAPQSKLGKLCIETRFAWIRRILA